MIPTVAAGSRPSSAALASAGSTSAGIEKAIETYGRGNRSKHRAVFYYLLAKHFGRESAYA